MHSRILPSFVVNQIFPRAVFVLLVHSSDINYTSFIKEFMMEAEDLFILVKGWGVRRRHFGDRLHRPSLAAIKMKEEDWCQNIRFNVREKSSSVEKQKLLDDVAFCFSLPLVNKYPDVRKVWCSERTAKELHASQERASFLHIKDTRWKDNLKH